MVVINIHLDKFKVHLLLDNATFEVHYTSPIKHNIAKSFSLGSEVMS